MSETGTRRNTGRIAMVAAMVTLLAACPGSPTTRDTNDSTAPSLTMSIAGTKQNPGGIDDNIAPGSTTELRPQGAQILIKATDSGGVSFVELWLTEKEACPGVNTGPSLAGKAAARTNGTVTATKAPSSLTAAYRIEPAGRKVGCTYTFEVWGEADNAASTPVHAKSQIALVVLQT
jgi:hypothetical protein